MGNRPQLKSIPKCIEMNTIYRNNSFVKFSSIRYRFGLLLNNNNHLNHDHAMYIKNLPSLSIVSKSMTPDSFILLALYSVVESN